MSIEKPQLGKGDYTVLEDECVYDGFFKLYELRLKHKMFSGEWTSEINRLLFHRGEAAATVVYDPENNLVGLIEQFRIGALESDNGPWCLEVVAGMLEPGETPEELIHRELEEEAGIKNAKLLPITSYYSTPGGCSEKIYLFCALCDLSTAGGVHGLDAEDEDIFLHVYPTEKVFEKMLNSRMNNAATLIGLQWLQANLTSLRK